MIATVNAIQQRYNWPGMYKDIEHYVNYFNNALLPYTSPSVSVASRQELTHKGRKAAFVCLYLALCALRTRLLGGLACVMYYILGVSRLDSSSAK